MSLFIGAAIGAMIGGWLGCILSDRYDERAWERFCREAEGRE